MSLDLSPIEAIFASWPAWLVDALGVGILIGFFFWVFAPPSSLFGRRRK